PPEILLSNGIQVDVWQGPIDRFLDQLEGAAAPNAGDIPVDAIRVGRQTVSLSSRNSARAKKRFAILTERQIVPSSSFTVDHLQRFLAGDLEDWTSFTVGLPVARKYRSNAGLTLSEEVKSAIEFLQKKDAESLTSTIRLPVEGASGATTMLRSAAFWAASNGYPTILLKPNQVDIDIEELLAFATSLNEAALAAGVTDVPPFVLVSDCE